MLYESRGRGKFKRLTLISMLCDKIFLECCTDEAFSNPDKLLLMAMIKRAILDVNDKRVSDLDVRTARYYLEHDVYLQLKVLEVDEDYFREQIEKHGYNYLEGELV